MRLNIGCGRWKHDGWVNIDRQASCEPDVLIDGVELPLEDDCAERVYLGHILEHLSYELEAPALLHEVARVLHRRGQLAVVGPDYDAAVRLGFDQDTLDDIVVGPRSSVPGASHLWTATAANTFALVSSVFPNCQLADLDHLADVGWPLTSLIGWQVGLLAKKGTK